MRQVIGSGDANQSYVLMPINSREIIQALENDLSTMKSAFLDKCDECERLRDILRDVFCSGFEEGHPAIDYHTLQIDKRTWDDIRRAIK